jgi:hypothetical protein
MMLDKITSVDDDEEEEPKEKRVTAVSLMLLTVKELKEICRQNDLKGWSKLRKLELVEFITSYQ